MLRTPLPPFRPIQCECMRVCVRVLAHLVHSIGFCCFSISLRCLTFGIALPSIPLGFEKSIRPAIIVNHRVCLVLTISWPSFVMTLIGVPALRIVDTMPLILFQRRPSAIQVRSWRFWGCCDLGIDLSELLGVHVFLGRLAVGTTEYIHSVVLGATLGCFCVRISCRRKNRVDRNLSLIHI